MSKVIKILGTGCPKCKSMTAVVEDIMEIMKFNVMTTPALVINEAVTIKGRVPTKSEVLALLN